MKIRNLLLAGLVTILAWSCSEDALQGGGTTTPEAASKKYMEVSIKMPATTRTGTSNSMDTEAGKDYENKVNEVLVVVLNSDTENSEGDICFVKSVKTAANSNTTTEGVHTGSNNSTVTARINDVPLETESDKYYIVYAFINPTQKMVEMYGEPKGGDWKDFYEQAAGTDVTAFINSYANKENSSFFMTDTGADAELSKYEAKKAEAFAEQGKGSGEYKLSATVKVERAVARFDYKASKTDNIYYFPLDSDGSEPEEGKADLAIQLEGYKLMNVSKSFYHLRRVTKADATGTAASEESTDITYGGLETSTNYVVDCDWTGKKAWLVDPNADGEFDKRAELFFTPLNPPAGTSSGGYKPLEDLEDSDNYENKGYYIMGYCTENTIPSIAGQLSGISTAMVFKAKVSGKLMKEADMTALYEYNGTVYNKWDYFKKAWNNQHEEGDKIDDKQDAEPTGDDLKALKVKIGGEVKRIPIFDKNEENPYGYVYYIYRNRHNDNNLPAVMGTMEFAVVRNNIYKLTVSKIAKLGYTNDPTEPPTTDPEPEVDPPTPDLPDEDSKAYMEVTVNILNWTVRENEIVFD